MTEAATDIASLVHVERVLGTAVSLHVTATRPTRPLEAVVGDAVAWLHDVHGRFTTFCPGSEWLRYATGELALDDAHPDIRHVVNTCASLEEQTDGAFSLTANRDRPPDPAAYVKGWALQRAAELLLVGGAETVMVNGGGDIVVAGGGAPWRVGIQHPTKSDHVAAVVELRRGAVATSAAYERGGHIVDPRTRSVARGWASVTVVGPDLGVADAFATAAFAMGRGAVEWLEHLDLPYSGYFIDDEARSSATGFGTRGR